MKSFFEWFAAQAIRPDEPWLILGKGPSFSRRNEFDLRPYRTMSLNHAVRELPVTVAHIIDSDVVDACGDSIERHAGMLVMPWIPHVNNAHGKRTLEELVRENAILKRMDELGRLLWYNLSSTSIRRPDSPVVEVKYFSSEAALNLLVTAGTRTVRSLGIDGGAAYSPSFDDLKDKTLLANRWKTFDIQFARIARTILSTRVDYAPLHLESPIRVYVACTESEMLPAKVLEFSIKKHASMTSEVFPLHLSPLPIPTPQDPKNHARTPFSFQRFLIPALAGNRGRAIYLDSDMQLFRDIALLWNQPFGDADLLTVGETGNASRRPQFSVMLLDCARLSWDIREIVRSLDDGTRTYEQTLHEMCWARKVRADLDLAWNCLERHEEGVTALLHYTDMPTQPWVYPDHPHGHLWMRDLLEAVDLGYITTAFIEECVRKGHVRPSLLYQAEHRIDEGLLLPKMARALDRDFVAPFESIQARKPGATRNPAALVKAYLRHLYHRSPVRRWVQGVRQRLRYRA